MRLIVRQLAKEDHRPYRKLFDEAYYEYLEGLRQSNLQQYRKELQDKRRVTSSRFDFVKSGSSFVGEEDGEVVGCVATQTIPYMRGHDKVLWIEYIITEKKSRQQGVATALLKKLKSYAKQHRIDTTSATINPDNIASIKLQKLGFNVKNWRVASFKVT